MAFELWCSIKAFLRLDVGISRNEVPDFEYLFKQAEGYIEEQDQKLKQIRRRLFEKDRQLTDSKEKIERLRRQQNEVAQTSKINPENIIWILGSPRTGSTWLGQMLSELSNHTVWKEPFFGVVLGFRNNLANRGYIFHDDFLLGEPHRAVWIKSMRRLFLEVGEAKFPNLLSTQYLVVKEPNGSLSAPLILEAFPESKLLFLTRDGRDVVASLLDAAKNYSWYGYDRYEASLADATMHGGSFVFPQHETNEQFVEQLARNFANNTNAVKRAYDRHHIGSKAIIQYEDLRENPLECIRKAYKDLRVELDETQLKKAIEEHSWASIPANKKGEGHFYRKARPGSWQEDLTKRQVEIVERVFRELLNCP